MKTKLLLLILAIFLASCSKHYDPFHSKSKWLKDFFEAVEQYDDFYAISYWNENFDKTYLKVNSSKRSLETFRELVSNPVFISDCRFDNGKLIPVEGKKYFGSFTFNGTEDTVTKEQIIDYEELIGKKIAWAYFSNNWLDSLIFPEKNVNEILEAGSIPYIRLMPRSIFEEGMPEPKWNLLDIINGKYDTMLKAWAEEAKHANSNLLVEFGTEVNGSWFSWNGIYYGGGTTDGYGDPNYPDGPEIFRDAYRHIIEICDSAGADNITWFFHFDVNPDIEEDWNSLQYYYPGDEYIDWIGVSVYGPFGPGDKYSWYRPDELIEKAHQMCSDISKDKPYAILEFGVTEM